jgi:predicted outer membrane repeat protein
MKTAHSKPVFHIITLLSLLLSLIGSAVFVTPAHAAPFAITNLNDSGPGSVRQAIINANASASAYTASFSVSGTIMLASTLPAIANTAGLTINGTGQTVTISGNNAVRVIQVDAGASLTLNDLTIANGYSAGEGGGIWNDGTLIITNSAFSGNRAETSGGGIYSIGTLMTITNSTFSGNSAIAGGDGIADGGGVYSGIGAGPLTITNSTFSRNAAVQGGGLYMVHTVNITNSTFSENSAGWGGAILTTVGTSILTIANSTFSDNSAYGEGGGINNGGTLDITNSTFSGNNAAVEGGGISSYDTATLRNTIVANSTGGSCFGAITNGGYNIDDGTTCGWGSDNGSMSSTDPLLGTLTGSPAYFTLDAHSPAIDAGRDSICAAAPVNNESQNGVTRPAGAHCDIGSYEAFLLAPSYGAILRNQRPTFEWSDITGATSYWLQVSENDTFMPPTLTKAFFVSTYTSTTNLPANTLFYWRVRAKVSGAYGDWSEVWTFTTGNPPSIPVLQVPADNALVSGPSPLFDWKDSTVSGGATFDHYQIQIAADAAFTSILHDHDLAGVVNSQDSDAVLNPATTYYWRVRSFALNGDYSAWSTARKARIKLDAPTLLKPDDTSMVGSLKPTFMWNAILGATSYTIQVSKFHNFKSTVINKIVSTPTYTATTSLSAGTTYYWRVKVNGPFGPSDWSIVFSFTTP